MSVKEKNTVSENAQIIRAAKRQHIAISQWFKDKMKLNVSSKIIMLAVCSSAVK